MLNHCSKSLPCPTTAFWWGRAPWPALSLTPAVLDRLADAELQHGHIAAAERLAERAAALREAGQ